MDINFTYEPRDWQRKVLNNLTRFNVLVLHRRAGKTVLDVLLCIAKVLNCPHKKPQAAYIAPTYSMAKKIAWNYFKEYLEPLRRKELVSFNESALRIDFKTGATIYLLGSEEPDSIRGIYLDFAVLDEYQMMPHNFFDMVIRPTLSDRKGGAIITGTPNGKNHFYDLYQKGLKNSEGWSSHLMTWKDTASLDENEIRLIRQDVTEEAFAQEYECSFDAAIRGSFFGRNINRLISEGRVKDVLHDPTSPVIVSWDLGFDGTAMWYLQKQNGVMTIIDVDCYENEDLTHGANIVLNKPYTYAFQLLPHDGNDRNLVDKRKTPKGLLESLGLKCKVVKRVNLVTAINSGRLLLDKCYIIKRCAEKKLKIKNKPITGLDALKMYRAKETGDGVLGASEEHDVYSNIGSSWRTLGEGVKESNLEKRADSLDRYKPTGMTQVNNNWDPFKR